MQLSASDHERAIYKVIRDGDPYINPIQNTFGRVSLAGNANNEVANNLIQLIIDSVPEPPQPTSSSGGSSEPPEKVIPPLEQSWIDTISLIFPHSEMISLAASTLNEYTSTLVSNYVETVPIHSTGAFVLDSFEGDSKGSLQFYRSYQLLMTQSATLIDKMLSDTQQIFPLIPNKLNVQTISKEMEALNVCLNTRIEFLPMVNAEILKEKSAQSKLVKAAKDYVLTSLSMSWVKNDNTKLLIESTGSDELKQVLNE